MANVSNEQIKIPRHLAIILDGNGRWALSQGQARTFGHKIGANTMKEMVNYAFSLGIEVISNLALVYRSLVEESMPAEDKERLQSAVKVILDKALSMKK